MSGSVHDMTPAQLRAELQRLRDEVRHDAGERLKEWRRVDWQCPECGDDGAPGPCRECIIDDGKVIERVPAAEIRCATLERDNAEIRKLAGELEHDRDTWQQLCTANVAIRKELYDALIWCSAAEDFQVGGKARDGWLKLVEPLIAAILDKKGDSE